MDSDRRLLMVDDKVALCFAMREYFNQHNYHVDCAHNVDDALTFLNTFRYAVVIADLDLSGTHDIDGFKVIKIAREQHPDTRIIVLTAYGSADIESEAQAIGVSAFLHKPMPLSDVSQLVHKLTGN